MASGSGLPSSGYEVVVPGRFGPAYHAAFAAMGAPHSEVSSVFFVSPPQGVGIPDIAAMLQARGLVILDIRRVESREPLIRGQPTPHTSHRGPVEGAPRVGARDTGGIGSRRHPTHRAEATVAHPYDDVPHEDLDEQQRPLEDETDAGFLSVRFGLRARRRRGRPGQAVDGRGRSGPDAYPGGSADKDR